MVVSDAGDASTTEPPAEPTRSDPIADRTGQDMFGIGELTREAMTDHLWFGVVRTDDAATGWVSLDLHQVGGDDDETSSGVMRGRGDVDRACGRGVPNGATVGGTPGTRPGSPYVADIEMFAVKGAGVVYLETGRMVVFGEYDGGVFELAVTHLDDRRLSAATRFTLEPVPRRDDAVEAWGQVAIEEIAPGCWDPATDWRIDPSADAADGADSADAADAPDGAGAANEPDPADVPARPAILREDGIGQASFGDDHDVVVDYLVGLFGPPTAATHWSEWVEPVGRYPCDFGAIRTATWGGLTVSFVMDVSGGAHLRAYDYSLGYDDVPLDSFGLTTTRGIGLLDSWDDVTSAYPDASYDPGADIFWTGAGHAGWVTADGRVAALGIGDTCDG